jgi:hypothetical protein
MIEDRGESCKDGQVCGATPGQDHRRLGVKLGSKWTKRMQKESRATDGGVAVDMEEAGTGTLCAMRW